MECRAGCGACCIAPSISSPIPGMPNGKPANTRCVQLDAQNLCIIFGKPERPAVCSAFTAQAYVCGESREEALILLAQLECDSAP
jgi:Fe-S-cluster containining protein